MPLRRRNIGRKAKKSESEGCRARRTDQTAAETAEEREARLQATRDRRAAESSEVHTGERDQATMYMYKL